MNCSIQRVLRAVALFICTYSLTAAPAPPPVSAFLRTKCFACHNPTLKQGGLDLQDLTFQPEQVDNFALWVKVHDRVRDGEMPPVPSASLTPASKKVFLHALATPLIAADRARYKDSGRAVIRRLNRQEYENTLRDLLGAPWLQIQEMLPEDGIAWKFNKSGEALDVSHVHMNQYLLAADYALREVAAPVNAPPENRRFYSRDQNSFFGQIRYPKTNERDAYPVVGSAADVPLLHKEGRKGPGDPKSPTRDLEGIAVICSSYEPIELRFNKFTAPASGRYRLRLNAHTVWVGPEKSAKWWRPDPENISAGRTVEPITLYSERPPRQQRWLGRFDVHPEAGVNELEVELLKGETIRVDAARFFRSRPVTGGWRNPLATKEGQPGVSFRWLEVEGPTPEPSQTAGQTLLFGDPPLTSGGSSDIRRLIAAFLQRAYRKPPPLGDVEHFAAVADRAMSAGYSFRDAIIAADTAVLISPGFVTTGDVSPGPLDGFSLASRLSYFLWNTEPDAQLRQLAAEGKLLNPAVLRAQTVRLLTDARAQRFVQTFLDYWLDLRRLNYTSPDENLYPDYYLDDYLVESAGEETRAFFSQMLAGNLPSRNVVSSGFAMLNERLADIYGIPGVKGSAIRRVELPPSSTRGGIMTQASVLKVTANGTTTSPVLRGIWISERILGHAVPKQPLGVPSLDPDVRGAATIRDQLARHRSQEVCRSCHSRIDPPGFALETFDVAGGERVMYRSFGGSGTPAEGVGKNGHLFEFRWSLPVDASGVLPDGRKFSGVRELKTLFLADERAIAANLASQLIVYATGAPVRFGDRPQLEAILDRAQPGGYGTRDLIEAIVESPLFRSK